MSDHAEALKSLHTSLIDSREGYKEALNDAEGKGLTPLFRQMIELRNRHIGELSSQLKALGEEPDVEGSFMSTVHRTVISVRSLLTGLDESILPGLIDGEKRIVESYDEAIAAAPSSAPERAILTRQREEVTRKIAEMQTREAAAG